MARVITKQKRKLQDANLVNSAVTLSARWLAIKWLSFIKANWVQILIGSIIFWNLALLGVSRRPLGAAIPVNETGLDDVVEDYFLEVNQNCNVDTHGLT